MVERKGRSAGAKPPSEKDQRLEIGSRQIVGPGEVIAGERQGGAERYAAPVNVRESVLGHMAARGRVDPIELLAGERFRRLCERAAVGPTRSLDPENFGTGGAGDPFSEQALRDREALAEAMQRLGQVACQVLTLILFDGRTIVQAAAVMSSLHGLTGKRAEGYVAGRFIEALRELAAMWRMEAAEGRPRRAEGTYKRNGQVWTVRDAIRASGPMSMTGPSYEISVDDWGQTRRERKRPVDNGPLQVHSSGSAETTHSPRRKR